MSNCGACDSGIPHNCTYRPSYDMHESHPTSSHELQRLRLRVQELEAEIRRLQERSDEDTIAGLYHPEFGTEWQEGGSLSEIIKSAQADAWDFAMRAAHSRLLMMSQDQAYSLWDREIFEEAADLVREYPPENPYRSNDG